MVYVEMQGLNEKRLLIRVNNITRFQQPLLSYSLFYADRHAGFEPELYIVGVEAINLLLTKTTAPSRVMSLS